MVAVSLYSVCYFELVAKVMLTVLAILSCSLYKHFILLTSCIFRGSVIDQVNIINYA